MSTIELNAADETIIFPDFVVQVMKTGRGYFASLDGNPSIRFFGCRKSYAVGMVVDKVAAMKACPHDRTEVVEAISADIRGVGVDVSTYRCLDCGDVWSD